MPRKMQIFVVWAAEATVILGHQSGIKRSQAVIKCELGAGESRSVENFILFYFFVVVIVTKGVLIPACILMRMRFSFWELSLQPGLYGDAAADSLVLCLSTEPLELLFVEGHEGRPEVSVRMHLPASQTG